MMMPPCSSVAGRCALYGVRPRTEQNGTRHLIPTTATCRALLHLPPTLRRVDGSSFFKGVCYCIYKIFIKRWRIGRCFSEGGKRTLNAYCCVCINNWINKVANWCAISTKAPNGIPTLYFRLECSSVKKGIFNL